MISSLAGALLVLQFASGPWEEAPPLPQPLANNAVAALDREDGVGVVFSFFGVTASGANPTSQAYRWEVGGRTWSEIAPVPGPPRFGASAQVVGGRVYVIGGRARGSDGVERAVPSVDLYDPGTDSWSQGSPMPVPAADAVSALWRDSLIYVVAGRGDAGALTEVQIYDPASDRWSRGTPVAGPPVWGHTGALARDALVYVGGAQGAEATGAALESASWRGDIDASNPTTIRWTRLSDHPGPAFFGGAAGVVGTRVLFLGGGDRPHDRYGVGEGGAAAAPLSVGLGYDVATGGWRQIRVPAAPSMDHRALARAGGYLLLVGGREAGALPTARVRRVSVLDLLAGP